MAVSQPDACISMSYDVSRPRIAVSSCLLGEPVRYDGGHKHNRYITNTLGQHFDCVSFCPEMAIGMGAPRPPIRLVQEHGAVHARGVENPDNDVTQSLIDYGRAVAAMLDGVCGYILKARSPSCGMERVKLYDPAGVPAGTHAGIFAGEIARLQPALPMEEEGRLMDPVLRENFIERVFVYHRWLACELSGFSAASLQEFHSRHKFALLAHDETVYRELGRMLAGAGKANIRALAQDYIQKLMSAFRKPATAKRHANVLMHILGFFRERLDSDDKQEMLQVIDACRCEQLPLVVPITLIKHHLRRFPDEYIGQQFYLNPHPQELMLRNHI